MAQLQNVGTDKLVLPCGRVFGVPLRVHVLLPLVALLDGVGAALAGSGARGIVLAVLVGGPLLFITVLVHELGHVFAARRCGCTPDHILLWPLGGIALIGFGSIGPKEQIFVSACGPATHLPMLLLWMGLMALANLGRVTLSLEGMSLEDNFFAVVCVAMLTNNLAMLLFNLLVPCFPLDCSQILVSFMLLRGVEPGSINYISSFGTAGSTLHIMGTAAKVLVGLSLPVLLVLLITGIVSSLAGSPSASLNVVLACWLAMQSWSLHQARLRGQLASYPLFASACRVGQQSSESSTTSQQPNFSGASVPGTFRPFQGSSGTALGKPCPG